eukprot:5612000-Pyramimonas_sp.AAC.1
MLGSLSPQTCLMRAPSLLRADARGLSAPGAERTECNATVARKALISCRARNRQAKISRFWSICPWKMRRFLRARRFHADAELICLFKTHVLSCVEYRTSAVYHASSFA